MSVVPEDELGLYVHVPFCARRCPYCDFATSAGRDHLQERYVAALEREIQSWRPRLSGSRVSSLYVGGGTPTHLPPGLLARVLQAARDVAALAPDSEVTVEANPGTVDAAALQTIRSFGANRLSLGAQSFDDAELAFLGRTHTAGQTRRAFEAARAAGFENVSLDLIFGLPEQSMDRWVRSLSEAIALEPEHLSLYGLTVEPGTPLHAAVASGATPAPSEDRAADQLEHAMERLDAAGFLHYEVSNWARRSPSDGWEKWAGRHNLNTWRNGSYLGFGVGAHSHAALAATDTIEERRWANPRDLEAYLDAVERGSETACGTETIDRRTARGETMMLGLRLLREGVVHTAFAARHGRDPREAFAAELGELEGLGLLTVDDEATKLTQRGLMLGNQVFARFVP